MQPLVGATKQKHSALNTKAWSTKTAPPARAETIQQAATAATFHSMFALGTAKLFARCMLISTLIPLLFRLRTGSVNTILSLVSTLSLLAFLWCLPILLLPVRITQQLPHPMLEALHSFL